LQEQNNCNESDFMDASADDINFNAVAPSIEYILIIDLHSVRYIF